MLNIENPEASQLDHASPINLSPDEIEQLRNANSIEALIAQIEKNNSCKSYIFKDETLYSKYDDPMDWLDLLLAGSQLKPKVDSETLKAAHAILDNEALCQKIIQHKNGPGFLYQFALIDLTIESRILGHVEFSEKLRPSILSSSLFKILLTCSKNDVQSVLNNTSALNRIAEYNPSVLLRVIVQYTELEFARNVLRIEFFLKVNPNALKKVEQQVDLFNYAHALVIDRHTPEIAKEILESPRLLQCLFYDGRTSKDRGDLLNQIIWAHGVADDLISNSEEAQFAVLYASMRKFLSDLHCTLPDWKDSNVLALELHQLYSACIFTLEGTQESYICFDRLRDNVSDYCTLFLQHFREITPKKSAIQLAKPLALSIDLKELHEILSVNLFNALQRNDDGISYQNLRNFFSDQLEHKLVPELFDRLKITPPLPKPGRSLSPAQIWTSFLAAQRDIIKSIIDALNIKIRLKQNDRANVV